MVLFMAHVHREHITRDVYYNMFRCNWYTWMWSSLSLPLSEKFEKYTREEVLFKTGLYRGEVREDIVLY